MIIPFINKVAQTKIAAFLQTSPLKPNVDENTAMSFIPTK